MNMHTAVTGIINNSAMRASQAENEISSDSHDEEGNKKKVKDKYEGNFKRNEHLPQPGELQLLNALAMK